ncbi:hypothetical protein AB0L28_33395 [Streptomyces sp. NPDC052503]|uniref:hypothetical protein n=1 Tax=Streptomyces sp. NPDC052503 TaxID=3156683 RepID=UPI00136D0A3A|nr:hypothetical protein [Streptomyces sp. SID7834]MYT59870.1 hypothetical protein [Streptomyces sp. SID7834]
METARTTAEAERREQDAERTAAQRADRHRQQAQAGHQAAETELRTAQLREQAARIEGRPEHQGLRPLYPARRVGRLLLIATPAGQETRSTLYPSC